MGILQEFILQEEAEINYATMALYVHKPSSGILQLTLLDKAAFLKTTPEDFERNEDLRLLTSFVIAMVRLSKTDAMGKCNGAWSVINSARNRKYPGFGKLLYAVASAYVKAPLTSDKFHSTSATARAMWKRIDNDPSFERTGEFDHFSGTDYYRREKNGSYTKTQGPRTKSVKDDCALPLEPNTSIPFGYKSQQQFDFGSLNDGLNEMVSHAKKVMGLPGAVFLRRVNDAALMLFGQEYIGEEKDKPEVNSDFRTIVEAKCEGNYRLMSEASLQRIYAHFLAMKNKQPNASFAMLTSWRQSLSTVENEERLEHLKGLIRGMGLGFILLDGYWKECSDPDVSYDDCPPDKLKLGKEKSLFIPGIKLEQAKKLMEVFEQDAIVYAGPEVSNEVSLVFRVDGSVVSLGEFTPNSLGVAWSELKGKAFHFEWVAQSATEKLIESLFS